MLFVVDILIVVVLLRLWVESHKIPPSLLIFVSEIVGVFSKFLDKVLSVFEFS